MPNLHRPSHEAGPSVEFAVSVPLDLLNCMSFTALAGSSEGLPEWVVQTRRTMDPALRDELDFLMTYAFPGNIRELENLIEQGVALADDGVLKREDMMTSEMVLPEGSPRREGGTELQDIVDQAERQHIEKTLREVEGNKERAAELLGLSSTTLWRKMKRLRVVAP